MPSFEEFTKEQLKKKKKNANAKNTTFTEYTRSVLNKDDDEIEAPLSEQKQSSSDDDIAPVIIEEKPEEKPKEKDEERTWFKPSGADNAVEGFFASVGDALQNFGTGLLGIGEGFIDGLLTIAPYVAQGQYYANGGGYNLEADKLANQMFEDAKRGNAEIVKKDLINEEEISKQILSGLGSAAYMYGVNQGGGFATPDQVQFAQNLRNDSYKYIDEEMQIDSVFGDKSDSLVQSGGQLAGTAALTAMGVPSWLTIGATALGGESENALNSGATMDEAAASGLISAGAEILSEKISGGINFGMGTLDDGLSSALASNISSKALQTLTKLGVDMAGEGGEEIFSGVISAIGQKLTYAKEEELFGENGLFSSEDAFESFIGGAVLGGVSSGGKAVNSTIKGFDPVTELTQNEQKVVDRVYKDAIAEETANGKKLTPFDKKKIYDDVLNDFSKGYISTDIVESVLGGEDYNTYKSEVKRQQDLDKELNELRNMKSGEMTDIQQERMAELKAMKPNTEMTNTLKFGIDEKIRNALTADGEKLTNRGSYLAESYNEKARRGQAFDADLSKYDAKQQKVIKSAIDSGILNNTNRTHEFVDMVAKISADKGVPFDFTNNQKLKDSGFAIDGKQVNGFVTKDGVTLNIDSRKSLNRVVGHEISHVLEGTELYGELSKAITEYAKSKGDYQGRYDTLTALYKGVKDADIDAELTADLVGDYLFTDEDFINNLSTKHRNVFQKVYDEIKYLCKVATAGSKEARELEKVKRAFEKAYKESGKAKGETKYSLDMVEPIKPTSDKWAQSATTDEVRAKHPTLYAVDETATEKRNPTQVKGTVGSYRNIYDSLKAEGFNGTILDASSGLGYGTKVGVEEYGFKVDDIEPYPDSNYKPKYTDYSALDKTYDVVISNAVLNVLPQDQRDALVVKMGESLNPGGRMFVNVRGKDVLNSKNKVAINEANMEYFIPRTEKTGSYQKGFTVNELKAYLEDALGDGYKVEPTNILNGVSVIVTKDGGVKYSISDSDGKKLTSEQNEYFKDSKVRDENGNLKVMYHGSQDAGFHVFDPSMSDDGISLFFVDRNDVAASYSGTSETYEAQTIHTAEDMNKFIESIGVEGYEVVENNGKYTLLYEGERVADSTTAKGIYEEFCWYEGVGDGDANYKVYLNLTNPLIVDAGGKNWNNISREYSQEIADRYNSLTAEEKAALANLAEWGEYGIFKDEMLEARALAEQGASGVFDEAYTKNLARAYEKLGGANANLYDAFSIASDNFSEDSIKQFAVKQMNTRDYAKRAKEGGYDGVIIKNVHDNGGYSNGSEGASTVAIAFNSEQVKSVANDSPTGDKDIRYSLSEYTADEKKAHNKAVVDHFGKTYSWAETGYLLLDGTRLDLSGKHDGAPGGYRTVDHRDITEALGYDYGGGDYSGSLVQFMSEGNIRIIPECNGINLSVKPTEAQEQALSNYISRFRGEVMLDIDDLNGNTVVSVEYPYGTYYTKVLNDIREWFDNGKKPENAGNYSLTKEGETERRFGRYDVRGEDVRFDAPVAESVAPTVDNSVDETVTENVDPGYDADAQAYNEAFPPMEHSSTYEQDIEAIQAEMQDINDQYIDLLEEGKEDEAYALIGRIDELIEKGRELDTKARGLRAQEDADREGYLNSLDDTDVPAEMDAPYYTEREPVTLGDKALQNVTKKASDALFGLDKEDSAKMAQIVQKYAKGDITADELFDEIKREFQYSEEISNNEDILNSAKKHIRKTKIFVPPRLKAEFNGKYNDGFNAFRKEHFGHFTIVTDPTKSALKIDQLYGELNELYPGLFSDEILNEADQLQEIAEICTAAPTVDYNVSPYDDGTIQEVVDVINNGVNEYLQNETLKRLDQDREAFYESVNVKEDIAPTFDSTSKAQIKGQQTMFEDAPMAEAPIKAETKTEAPAEAPKIAKVLESTPEEQKKVNKGQKFRTYVLDKHSAIEDLSLKTGNRELMAKADFLHRSEAVAQRYIAEHLDPIRKKYEATGDRNAYETYSNHLHNIDRMSLEGKAQARLSELEAKFGPLMEDQIKAIAATEITDKTTERTANTIREAKEWLDLLEVKNKAVFDDSVTADKSREFVKNFEAKHADARELADALVEYNKGLRQSLVDGGLISQETADLWGEMYPHYVPISRVGKDGPAINVALDSKRTGVDAPIKRATGGNSDMKSLLDVEGVRTIQTFRAIARNDLGLELMRTLGSVVETKPATVGEMLDTFESENDELLKKGENGGNPTFTVFENGKRITFEITEELYDALKPRSEWSQAEIPVLSQATKFQRGVLTQFNPVFAFTNHPKDLGDVLVNSQHPIKTYAQLPNAYKELANAVRGKEGKWIKEYYDNGGFSKTPFDSKKKVFVDKSGVEKVLGFVPEKIADANEFLETAPRLAEYIASRKSGASIKVAMLDAARVTTNFAAGGEVTKFFNNNGATFLNASVEGFNQQVRNVREAKAKGLKGVMQLAAKYAIAGLPIMLLNHLLWDDDEDYEELSDYVKDNYYIVAKTEDGKFIRIPKGRAVAVIQNAFEQMKNLVTGDDEVDMARFGQLLVTNLAPNDPVENNVLAPILQAINNKTWYGGDLVPQRLQDMPTAEQYDETTDSISKWLGEKTGLSPYKINYVLDQYSGGIGDSLLPYFTPESDGNILAPFADKFTTDSTMKNQYVSDFYDTVDELVKNSNSMNATEEDTLKSKYMNSISSEIGELYAEKREIQNSNLSDKAKDEAVREIQRQIDDLAKESLDKYSTIDYQTARDGEYANIGNRYFKKNDKGEWVKLDDDAVTKYKVTSAVGDAPYATDGENHYRWYEPSEDAGEDAEAGWRRVTDKELERQNEVTSGLRITPEEYWGNKEEYSYAYDYPGKYAVSKAVGGYKAYKSYSSELYDIKADKDSDGKSISGSRKEKVIDWINNLDADYGTKIILFKSEYNADDTYNYEIIDYLNSRDDISYSDMETILKELGFTVDSEGNIYWD